MRITLYIILMVFAAPTLSFAEEPLEALQQGIEGAIDVLEDPKYQDASQKSNQQQKLWELMLRVFDFKEFSKRVLGPHWNTFSS